MNEILLGDATQVLKTMPDESVDCCITSPPYFGLRDYGVEGQIGLEETPEAYVQRLVELFQEVRRVLKKGGTLWLNLGDSYAGSGRGRDADGNYNEKNFENSKQATNRGSVEGRLINNRKSFRRDRAAVIPARKVSGKSLSRNLIEKGSIGNAWVKPPHGLKAKDLIGIPWRVAFALQAAGWYLRQDIIWSKPNPMPESVVDRCTKSHEYIFLLTKSSRYFYDAKAIQEPAIYGGTAERTDRATWDGRSAPTELKNGIRPRDARAGKGRIAYEGKRTKQDEVGKRTYTGFNERWKNGQESFVSIAEYRNKRSVWSITTKPFLEAHFATFPEDLIEPMILAGCPRGGVVLDPFMGAGTTAAVAKKFGRNYLGIELNPAYIKIAQKRLDNIETPLF